MINQVSFVPAPLLVLWGCRFGIHQSMSQRAHVPELPHLLHCIKIHLKQSAFLLLLETGRVVHPNVCGCFR